VSSARSSASLPRVVVTGAGGQLGTDLLLALERGPRSPAHQGLTRAECDIVDPHRVRSVLSDQARAAEGAGLVVVNAAAYTNVDGAESEEAAAYAINAAGTAHLAMVCAELGARLVHVSTDYVFAGDGTSPYEATDAPDPRTAYGRTKLAGEQAVQVLLGANGFVVRSGWLYGRTGPNFVKTMLRLAGERNQLQVVDDQRGAPTWTAQLAERLLELALADVPGGIYHCSAAGATTWFAFARAIFERAGLDPARVQPSTTAALARPAPRPAYSVLSARSWTGAGLTPLPAWDEQLDAAVASIGPELGFPPPA
jgi:dTDP-4-dehydrorhamnose reductase